MLVELKKRFDSLVMIQATMSHILGAVNREKVEEAAQLLGCDLVFYEKEVWSAFTQHDSVSGLKLSAQLNDLLSEIDKKKTFSIVSDSDLRGFLAYINALNQLVLRIH